MDVVVTTTTLSADTFSKNTNKDVNLEDDLLYLATMKHSFSMSIERKGSVNMEVGSMLVLKTCDL